MVSNSYQANLDQSLFPIENKFKRLKEIQKMYAFQEIILEILEMPQMIIFGLFDSHIEESFILSFSFSQDLGSNSGVG